MKLDDQTWEFLQGKKFSNSLTIPYDYYDAIPDRVELLSSLSKDKKIIHLGCLDHLPLIDLKIKANKWLHQQITKASAKCIGVDIQQKTYEYVKEKHGVSNILIRDITGPAIPEIINDKWDYAILGELLEHINNPVAYLTDINSKYASSIERIVITVPNVLRKNTFSAARQSKEVINSDHRYWFTPYTLTKVMYESGILMEELLFANRIPLNFGQLIRKKIVEFAGSKPLYPFTYASSIVAIGKLSG